jgi:hypothetical protein
MFIWLRRDVFGPIITREYPCIYLYQGNSGCLQTLMNYTSHVAYMRSVHRVTKSSELLNPDSLETLEMAV